MTTSSTDTPPKKKSKSLLNAVKDLKDLHAAINADGDEEDSFEAFGHCVATQLRKLSEKRALLAQKAIQNILSDYGIEDIMERNNAVSPRGIPSGNYRSSSTSTYHSYPTSSASASPQPSQYQLKPQENNMELYPSSQEDLEYTVTDMFPQPTDKGQHVSDKLASLVRSSLTPY